MAEEGWIKIYRKIQENPWVYKDNDYLSVWINLLLNTEFVERKVLFGSDQIILQPGQLVTGRKELAKMSNVSESKVERILKRFKNEHQIEQTTNKDGRLITIINWHLYQGSGHQSEQQVDNNRTTSEQQVDTIIRIKELKNKRNKESIEVDQKNEKKDLFDQFWQLYPKKIAKQAAIKAWAKLTLDQKSSAIAALPNHITCEQWQKDGGQFIPHPATWLNSGRWEDDITASSSHSEYGPEFQRLSAFEKKTLLKMAEQYEKNLGEVATQKHIEHWIKTKL